VAALSLPDPVLDLVEGVRLEIGEEPPSVIQCLGPCLAVAGKSVPVLPAWVVAAVDVGMAQRDPLNPRSAVNSEGDKCLKVADNAQ
jgi:hypothetical protein